MNPKLQRIVLRLIGLGGIVVFGIFFTFTYAIPDWVETFAADFIERKATEKIDESIDSLQLPQGEGLIGAFARSLQSKNQERIEELREKIRLEVHERMADAIAKIRDLDCECRDKWAEYYKRGFQFEMNLLQSANDKLVDFIHYKYTEIATNLKADIRIFTGSNFVIFLLLLLVSFAKPQAMAHLFLPGSLLTFTTLVCSYFYLFEQNWLLTIVYNDYTGFAYLVYLGVLFLTLCDIVFNRARVTTAILNALGSIVGSAASFSPC
ncbi:hypothetical protein IEN85_22660 [Pelagicoccus sp. NFK12]|uniref:Uncharacterized protein n=1 Tax=Pelagicoccus enzymogenes TaxID=2773457 RepID=A0A927FCH3_9BACT|nr:hypothetical protein [Pelagicoccus enzymogenes]MBD5782319.1 hypothetical protein [Pelagicoccus enzymogenes]